eukprot:129970_1
MTTNQHDILPMLLHKLPSVDNNLTPLEIDDILLHVFEFASPLELCSIISYISKHWRNLLVNHKNLWLRFCTTFWKGKFYIISKATEIENTDPLNAYKISYIDQERNVITFEELTCIKWHFRFKWDTNPLHIAAAINKEETVIVANFGKDGTLRHEPVRGQFNWSFVNESDKSYSKFFNYFGIAGTENKNKENETKYGYYGQKEYVKPGHDKTNGQLNKSRWIQVNHFPPLVVTRNSSNWGFVLQKKNIRKKKVRKPLTTN